jgi:ABC-type lipoprotein release transport system permease subunit
MLLLRLAFRNLLTHKWKTGITGGLLVIGTFVVVVGQALLASLDQSMAQSIVHSISGHIQVQQEGAKDKLAIFGSPNDGTEIGHIDDFPKVRKVLEALPEVEAVVPMGINTAVVFGGNIVDRKLAELRQVEKGSDEVKKKALRDHVRRIVGLLRAELKNLDSVADKSKLSPDFQEGLQKVEKAATAAFWQDYARDPLAALETLDNDIAPMAMGEEMIFLRYLGADTVRFAKAFHRFELVDGQMIPAGKRGFLFNKLTYEEMCKHKTARRLDKMKDRMAEGWTIAGDAELQQHMDLNRRQYKEITYQLDDLGAADVRKALQDELKSAESDLVKLVDAFMTMDDVNFARRYKVFYDAIAPRVQLYSVKIGDVLTISGLTEAGYPTNVNVPVYGTFRFKSLDKSALAGNANLMDLMTFRDLYGFMTSDRKAEVDALKLKNAVKTVAREDAEAALFGDDSGADEAVEVAAAPSATSASEAVAAPDSGGRGKRYDPGVFARTYGQDEIDGGIVRNAAVILKPGADERKVLLHIQGVSKAQGLKLRVVDWRDASGMVAQFLGVIYAVLVTALLVIFLVALVVINNSMVMATMERVREIGTLRAIGAQRSEILRMFLLEALVLGLLFGTAGATIGAGTVLWMQQVGIPAFNDFFIFLFAGPRLHPFVLPHHLIVGFAVAGFVTVFSTLYPAWLATRITPLQAMSEAE